MLTAFEPECIKKEVQNRPVKERGSISWQWSKGGGKGQADMEKTTGRQKTTMQTQGACVISV